MNKFMPTPDYELAHIILDFYEKRLPVIHILSHLWKIGYTGIDVTEIYDIIDKFYTLDNLKYQWRNWVDSTAPEINSSSFSSIHSKVEK